MNSFDPLDFAFRTGQELYKAGLMALINGRRQSRGLAPIGWPSVATTPADVVWTDGSARLLRYRRDEAPPLPTAVKAKTPLLLICSLINRPYVLDLLTERSVVRRLLERGHDVWMLDWGTPAPSDATRTLGSYALDLLPRAAAVVTREAKREQLHLLGYCMGGTFSLMATAAGRVPAASLVTMATPVSMHDDGLLSLWCRAPGFEPAELAEAYGNVPPHVLQPAFKLLDPLGLASKFVHLDNKVEDEEFLRFFLAMETWLEDSVAFPGRAFVDWVELYRSDALAHGRLVVDGTTIDLARVRCPLFNIVAEGDYITPPPSSLALEKLAGAGEHQTVRVPGGHIGLSTGRSAHEKLWPAVSQFLHAHDAPAQKQSASAHKDSASAQTQATPAQRDSARAQKQSAAAHKESASAQKDSAPAQNDARAQKKMPTAARKVARPQPDKRKR